MIIQTLNTISFWGFVNILFEIYNVVCPNVTTKMPGRI